MTKKQPEHGFDRHGLSLKPQNVTKHVWYYEETRGLCVIVQIPGYEIPAFTIPWRMLRLSLLRKDLRRLKP